MTEPSLAELMARFDLHLEAMRMVNATRIAVNALEAIWRGDEPYANGLADIALRDIREALEDDDPFPTPRAT